MHARTRTPLPATLVVSLLVLVFALWLPLLTLAKLTWSHDACPLARFVLMLDDTTFVNTRRVSTVTRQEGFASNRVYGTVLRAMQPDRRPGSPHEAGEAAWPWPYFPSFVGGPVYLISGDTVPRLLVAASRTPTVHLTQVFLTGAAALTGKIMRIGIARFFVEGGLPEEVDECSYARHGAISGVRGREEMAHVWKDVRYVQDEKNVTCTISPKCLAEVNGKCLFRAPEPKKKRTRKTGASKVGERNRA